MNRRAFVTGLGAVLAASFAAEAQPAGKTRIGWLTTGPHPFIEAFRQGLRDLGYVEGQNIVLLERYSTDHLASLADELVKLKVDLIVSSGSDATTAARRATTSIPIVFVSGNPLEARLVGSLAHPSSNVTGLSIQSSEVSNKWVELARDVVPGLSRVALLSDGASGMRFQLETTQTAANALGLRGFVLEARKPEEINRAFQTAATERAGALIPLFSPLFASEKQRFVDLAARYRLPVVYEHRDFVEAGGLVSYGPDLRDVFKRAAGYVDKILKGAKPADLPVEQPTKFELVINLKTAKALGLTIPPSLLLRADLVIE